MKKNCPLQLFLFGIYYEIIAVDINSDFTNSIFSERLRRNMKNIYKQFKPLFVPLLLPSEGSRDRRFNLMRKIFLIAIAALSANVQAIYSQETGTIAPKPAYTCDFENTATTDFTD